MVQYDYDPFGNIIEQTGDVNNSITYAGYQYDAETDLYYLNARYYDSKIARFISEDTYKGKYTDPLSLNLYVYCSNNPIIYFDPTGHWQAGDEALNDEAKAQIIALGIAWTNAKTDKEREKIAKEAEKIRKNKSSWGDKDTLVDIDNVDDYDKYMTEVAMADGILTPEEEAYALTIINGNVTVKDKDYKSSTSLEVKLTIGKSDITVTSLFYKKSTNAVLLTNIEHHYEYYIFYLPEWESETENNIQTLCEDLGVSRDDIGTASLTSNDQFTHDWNSMGLTSEGKNISTVIINTHGNPYELTYCTTSDVSKLFYKNIDNLILYGCNAGHLDHVGTNIASEFAKKINGGKVMASDGTVDSGCKRLTAKDFLKIIFLSKNDKEFKRFCINGYRDNEGWIIYQYTNGCITATKTNNKFLTLKEMLIKMK